MYIRDIIAMLYRDCSFGDKIDYMGKIALYFCILKRRDSSGYVSTSCSDLYCRYFKWEAIMTNNEETPLSARFFGNIYTGMIADEIVRKGEAFINELYLAQCNMYLSTKPFQGTLIDYVESWLERNECKWLSYVM